MRWREFITLISGAAAALPLIARAQVSTLGAVVGAIVLGFVFAGVDPPTP